MLTAGMSTVINQFVVVTNSSGPTLTFDGVWHFGEVFFSQMNPSFLADSVHNKHKHFIDGVLTRS